MEIIGEESEVKEDGGVTVDAGRHKLAAQSAAIIAVCVLASGCAKRPPPMVVQPDAASAPAPQGFREIGRVDYCSLYAVEDHGNTVYLLTGSAGCHLAVTKGTPQ
jgi:hypothetical protein